MPSTRTINETREVTTSYTVTRTYLPVVNHGVAQQQVQVEGELGRDEEFLRLCQVGACVL